MSSLVSGPNLVDLSFTSIGAVVGNANCTRVNVNETANRGETRSTTTGTVGDPLLRASVANTGNVVVGMANNTSLNVVRVRATSRLIGRTTSGSTGVVLNTVVSRSLNSRVRVAIVTANFSSNEPSPVGEPLKNFGSVREGARRPLMAPSGNNIFTNVTGGVSRLGNRTIGDRPIGRRTTRDAPTTRTRFRGPFREPFTGPGSKLFGNFARSSKVSIPMFLEGGSGRWLRERVSATTYLQLGCTFFCCVPVCREGYFCGAAGGGTCLLCGGT